jgi:hypothetical protein
MNEANLYKPFKTLNECSVAIYIDTKYNDCSIDVRYGIIEKYFGTIYAEKDLKFFFSRVEAIPTMFPKQFLCDLVNIDNKLEEICGNPYRYVKAKILNCLTCNLPIGNFSAKQFKAQKYFYDKKSEECYIISFKCKECETVYFPSYYVATDGLRKFYERSLEEKYISFTQESVFEILLLKSFTIDVVYKHASYSNFTNAHNSLFEHEKQSQDDRSLLFDKRLCETWLYFNLLIFKKEFDGTLKNFNAPFVQNLDDELKLNHQNFYSHFTKKWMHHQKDCKHPKCSLALNIDGNHKVNRLTCLFEKNILAFDRLNSK